MDNQRKWTGWVLISVIVLVAGVALVMTTLASPQAEPYPSQQPAEPTLSPTNTPEPKQAHSTDDRTANASVMGYAGPVLVRLTLDEQGAIEALDIGGARFMETEGLGGKVRDEAFIQPLIGKTPPLALGTDVDAVAGATLSSTAAVEAINAAHAFLTEEKPAVDSN